MPAPSFFGLPISATSLPHPSPTSGPLLHPSGLVRASPTTLARQRILDSLDEDSCCSFTEWKSAGYWVKKGSKSYFTDALGIPQFTKEQVTKSRW
jgi:hypothetical protein